MDMDGTMDSGWDLGWASLNDRTDNPPDDSLGGAQNYSNLNCSPGGYGLNKIHWAGRCVSMHPPPPLKTGLKATTALIPRELGRTGMPGGMYSTRQMPESNKLGERPSDSAQNSSRWAGDDWQRGFPTGIRSRWA